MATPNALDVSGTFVEENGKSSESAKEAASVRSSGAKADESVKTRVDAMWEQMNKGISNKELKDLLKKPRSTANKTLKPSSTVNKTSKKPSSSNWMKYLGLAPKDTASSGQDVPKKEPRITHNGSSDEAKKLAAAALAAAKDAAASASGWGKVEIMEVRDFAGQEIEYKKLVDADSKAALDKAKISAPSAVDAVLEQIKKKQKLSVLDKTKKDWGEFKEENKGLEDELDAYKKSSNQYLDKVSFLQRTDYREFERERDARLAVQAKRRPDMREDL